MARKENLTEENEKPTQMKETKRASRKPKVSSDPITTELEAVKKLLAYGLLRDGVTQSQLAAVLGTDQASVSRMFGKGAFKETKKAK